LRRFFQRSLETPEDITVTREFVNRINECMGNSAPSTAEILILPQRQKHVLRGDRRHPPRQPSHGEKPDRPGEESLRSKMEMNSNEESRFNRAPQPLTSTADFARTMRIAGGGNPAESATPAVYLQYAGCIAVTIVLDRSQSENEVEATAGGWWPSRRRDARTGGINAAGLAAAACVTWWRCCRFFVRTATLQRAPWRPRIIAGSAGKIDAGNRDYPGPYGPRRGDFMPQDGSYTLKHCVLPT